MIGFGAPWFLLAALVALPLFWLIYKLRQRSRRRVEVSSLFLWQHIIDTRQEGRRIEALRTTKLFWVELCLLCLLLIAAADPYLSLRRFRGPLVLVLDNSFSMRAGAPHSPRKQAEAALQKLLQRGDYSFVRLIGAGSTPEIWGGVLHTPQQIQTLLAQTWRCNAPTAQLQQALSLAWRLGGARARLLVLTDHPPPPALFAKGKTPHPTPSRLRWWAYGKAHENTALTHAARVRLDQTDWLLLEVAHFGKQPKQIPIRLELAKGVVKTHPIALNAGEHRRLRIKLPHPDADVSANLPSDASPIDDKVVLLSHPDPPLRVQLDISDENKRALFQNAFEATGQVTFTQAQPELIVMQKRSLPLPSAETWSLHWYTQPQEDDIAYTGPFVLHRTHPILRGLQLRGIVWGADKGAQKLPGETLLSVGEVPLLSLQTRDDEGKAIWLRWRPEISTLMHSPNWPILVWNLVDWRRSHRPGIQIAQVRLGTPVKVRVPRHIGRLKVHPPQGAPYEINALAGTAQLSATDPGLTTLKAPGFQARFYTNALSLSESDLRRAATGTWGQWPATHLRERSTWRLSWLLLLLACIAFLIHGPISRKERPL